MNPADETEWLKLRHHEANDPLGTAIDYTGRKIQLGAEWEHVNGIYRPKSATRGPVGGWVKWPFKSGGPRKWVQWAQCFPAQVTTTSPLKVTPISDVAGAPYTLATDLDEVSVVAPSSYTPTSGDVGLVVIGTKLDSYEYVFLPATGTGGGGGGGSPNLWGDGADGAVILDGTNTYPFLARIHHPSADNTKDYYQALRDIFPDTLEVKNNVNLLMNGFRCFAKTSITIDSGANMCNATLVQQTLLGVSFGTISPLTASLALPHGTGGGPVYSAGGNGGDGGADYLGNPGNPGGTVSPPVSVGTFGFALSNPFTKSIFSTIDQFLIAAWWLGTGDGTGNAPGWYPCWSGAQGGAGAFNGGSFGVNGDPGGVMVVASPDITNNGALHCDGGKGGDCNNPFTSFGGGGGGGGGGVCLIACQSYTGNAATANGGAGGQTAGAANPGTPGLPGSAGLVYTMTIP